MTYTLVNAAALAFELATLPAGPTIAQVLLTALTADADTLTELAREASDHPQRTREMVDPPHLGQLTGSLDLDRLVRHEMLGPACMQGTETGSWLRQRAADRVLAAASDAWGTTTNLVEAHPRPGTPGCAPPSTSHGGTSTLGPQSAAITDLLASLGSPHTRAAWRAARPAEPTAWAAAMHQACWAAHLSGRIRTAAHVQLLGVLAYRSAGFGPRDVAAGSWNALSGVLQAVVVADLLDGPSRAVLLAPARTDVPPVTDDITPRRTDPSRSG